MQLQPLNLLSSKHKSDSPLNTVGRKCFSERGKAAVGFSSSFISITLLCLPTEVLMALVTWHYSGVSASSRDGIRSDAALLTWNWRSSRWIMRKNTSSFGVSFLFWTIFVLLCAIVVAPTLKATNYISNHCANYLTEDIQYVNNF